MKGPRTFAILLATGLIWLSPGCSDNSNGDPVGDVSPSDASGEDARMPDADTDVDDDANEDIGFESNLTVPNLENNWASEGGPQRAFARIGTGLDRAIYKESGSERPRLVVSKECGGSVQSVNIGELGGVPTPQVLNAAANSEVILVLTNAGTDPGLWRSSDDGASWTSNVSAPIDVQQLVAADGQIYAVGSSPDDGSVDLFRTTNADDWTAVKTDFSFSSAELEVMENSIFVFNPPTAELHYSSDQGTTWDVESELLEPAFPWVRSSGTFYGLAPDGTLLESPSGANWSTADFEGVPERISALASSNENLLILGQTGRVVTIDASASNPSATTLFRAGDISSSGISPSIKTCPDDDVEIGSEYGLLRFDASQNSTSAMGLEVRSAPEESVGSSTTIMTPIGARLAEGQLFGSFGTNVLGATNGPMHVMAVQSRLYIGGQSEIETDFGTTEQRGAVYVLTSDRNWDRIAYDVQTYACGEQAGCDTNNEQRAITGQSPTSIATNSQQTIVGFRGAMGTGFGVQLDGGGLIAGGSGEPTAFTEGLPFRRCDGSETVEKPKAPSLCPPSIKDLTHFENEFWAATGDRFTDTFKVYRRANDDSEWIAAHEGLPAEFQDPGELNEDEGNEFTEADFAIADSTLFIRVRRMPEDTTTVYWFDESDQVWNELPSDGLAEISGLELLGSSERLMLGTHDGIVGWSQADRAWKPVGSNFPSVDANDFYLASGARIYAATDGRGVWSATLQ